MSTTLQSQAMRFGRIIAMVVVLLGICAGSIFAQERVTPWNGWKLKQWYKNKGITPPAAPASVSPSIVTPAGVLAPPDQADVHVFASGNPQTENSIAVNQTNPDQLMISTNGAATSTGQTWFFSTNGGATWSGSETSPNGVANYGDPVALFNYAGTTAYWGTLRDPGGIGLMSTTNLGTTWSAMTDADLTSSANDDKEHIMTDLSGVYPNNIYAAWTDFTPSPAIVRISRSTNGGTSWLAATSMSIGSDFGQGVNIATGPNGEVYVAFSNYVGGLLPEAGVRVTKSTDGGATWGPANIAFTMQGIRTTSGPIAAFGNTRVNSFPSMGVDRSNGPHRGWVYITYSDASSGDADNYMRYSSDGGTTWSAANQVNTDYGNQDWFSSIAVDAQTGDVSIGYYSQDTVGAPLLTARYVAHTNDAGATWERTRVSDVRFTPAQLGGSFASGYCGDYYETAAFGTKAWALWSDNRSGTFNAYVSKLQYAERFGYVKGTVTTGGSPLSGVAIDFVGPTNQQGATSAGDGTYKAGVKVDTPNVVQTHTIRAQKFGYVTVTDTVSVVLSDTVTRNLSMNLAPSGAIAGRVFNSDSASIKALIQVRFNGTLVVDDLYSDSLTGLYSVVLPNGGYDLKIDAPSPYGTLNYSPVTINNDTPYVSSMVRWVVEPSPLALTDTLGVGQSNTKNLLLTNTTADSIPFRLSNDQAAFLVAKQQVFAKNSPMQDPNVTFAKGEVDPRFGPSGVTGSGGPDAFGYVWLDSDGGGATYNWVDISSVGTQITAWTGTGDEGHAIVPLPFSFPFYGSTYGSLKITTNGWVSFDVVSTSHTYSNTTIPAAADPNLSVYAFWDDLDVSSSGGVYYYNDVANSQFIIQYNNAPHFTSGGPYTFEIILKGNGDILCQYQTINTPDNSASVGIENAGGTIGLQTAFNATYAHNNLAVLYKVRGVDWLTHTPGYGILPPSSSVNITNSFDATGLIPGTTYNADVFVDATHPDVQGSILVPAHLRVDPLVGPGIAVTPLTKNYGNVIIGQSKLDSVKIRNIGTSTLVVSEISTTNAEFAVTPSSGSVAPDDSLKVYITFSPLMPAGAKAATIHILSNDPINDTIDVSVSGTAVGVPQFLARVDSLTKILEGGTMDSVQFYVRNQGTLNGDFAARAVMYPRTLKANGTEPVIIPMKVAMSPMVAVQKQFADDSPSKDPFLSLGKDQADPRIGPTVLLGSGGPDSLGYTWIDSDAPGGPSFNWVDISGVGTPITLSDDQNAGPFPMGFSFTYYGRTYNSVRVCSNGWLSFTSTSTSLTNTVIPTATQPNDLLAGFWDDLNPSSSGTVQYYSDLANQRFIVQFTNVPRYLSGGPYTFQFILNADGKILMQYLSMQGTRLNEATIGIEDSTGTVGLQVAFNATYVHDNLAILFAPPGGGGLTAPWLFIRPTAGTVPTGDSVGMYARFEATDPTVFNNPGNYTGRIEISATNSALADTLKIPARMFVIPPAGARMFVDSSALHFGSVALSTTKDKSVLVKNIGGAPLVVTGIGITDARFTATPTVFTINSLDTQRVTVSFTPPLALPYSGTMSFASNDASAPTVALSGAGVGVPAIAVAPDSFYFNMPSGQDTNSQAMKIRNPGTDTLRYKIDEVNTLALAAAQAVNSEPAIELPKGVEDVRKGPAVLLGTGGPDAFGYRWVDSDESGGPVYNWVDISSVGTAVTWTGDGDEGHAIVPMPFSFPFYGTSYNSVKITSNGWVSFDVVSTNHTYSNAAIPTAAEPNLAVFGFWDDLDSRTSGGVYYYYDAINAQFIVQYNNVPHYSTGGPYTFEIILKQSGEIVCQYQSITTPDNSASIGIENAAGTVGLQTAFNATYVHNNLALMFTADLYPWMSTSVTQGTIAPGDSQTIQVKAHPGLIPNATYNGKFRITGNTPDTAKVPVRLDVVGGTPYITVTYPNGGEMFVIGQSYNITWNKNLVDTAKIEYSTNSGVSWILIKDGTPAGAEDLFVHPKERGKVTASSKAEVMGTYLWTIPNTPTTQALVRVSDKANGSISDVSNAVFTITSTPPAVWASQTSGTTSALYSVSIVDDQVAWAVGVGGVARRTTNGGTTWQTIGTLPADAHMVYAIDATTALACVNPSAGNDGRIYRTTNGGTGWSLVYQNTGTGAFMDAIHMFDASNGIAIGDPLSAQWLILRTTNGGATWAPSGTLAQAGTEAGWNNSFVWTDNNHGWFGTSNSRIYYTTDGGTSWAFGTTPAPNSYGVAMLSNTLGLAGAATGGTARTANGGASWTAASTAGTGTVFPAGVSVPTNRFWGTSGTTVYKTTDDGTTWTVDHSRAAAFDHIAFKVVPSANVIVGYAVGESGQISKYTEYLQIANEPASISGVKFVDVDGDSVKDAGEPGLAGWKIYLSGVATDSAITDANGYYMFDSLGTGAYTVSEAGQAGWIQTFPVTGSYAITLASGDSITGTNFGNFRLGSVTGLKWKDVNGNGVKDPGEPGLAGWQIQAARLHGAPLGATTNGAGQYTLAGLMADSYTIGEVQQSGYTQTYPVTPGTHAVLMVSGLDTVNVDFGNFYPDTAQYRTFAAESLALGKDIKGKVGKFNKRKADKVEFLFSLLVPTGPLSNVLNLEFSMIVAGKITNNAGDSIASISGKKPAALTLPVTSGQTIWVKGWGVMGKAVKVKYAFGSAKKVVLTSFALNQPRLPMPNTYNLLSELYLQNAFASTGGLVVGVPLTGIDAIRYGWVKMAKFSDVQKSLYQKGVIHNGIPRNFDLLGTKPFIKMQKNLQPSKHNNALFGELLALGVNITASSALKTPLGFGELIYNDGTGGPLNGKTVSEIDSLANYFITYNMTSTGLTADSLYRVVRKLNLAFSGVMDTISFAGSLVLDGVRPISGVSYLQPNFGAQPKTLDLAPLDPTEMPSTFTLSQNYPNPFNPTTSIEFTLPADGFVTMRVYDILGREVASIFNREALDEGEHTVEFSANDLASGVYFYRLVVDVPMDGADLDEEGTQMETYQSFKKFVLMK